MDFELPDSHRALQQSLREFCEENFSDLEDKAIAFFERDMDEIIRWAMDFSDFPEADRERMFQRYKGLMDQYWRPNAREYMKPVILS